MNRQDQQQWREWFKSQELDIDDVEFGDFTRVIDRLLLTTRQTAFETACKAICNLCATRGKPGIREGDGKWMHFRRSMNEGNVFCDAAAIRQKAQEDNNG